MLTLPQIRLRSDGYIAPGLSMFVYIDGEYQCNRGRNNLKVPTSTTQKHHTNVDFVVRQKEESLSDGNFLGRQWLFGNLDGASSTINHGSSHSTSTNENMATIEVVVLRSIELQRPKAPGPSISELHPIVFQKPESPKPSSPGSGRSSSSGMDTEMSNLGGLFDGTSDIKERQDLQMHSFGGDMAWDDEDQHNRGQHFNTDWGAGSQHQNAQNHHHGRAARSHAPSRSESIPAPSPAVQIFVNQPAAGSTPAPWTAAEPSQWRRPPNSIADSWGAGTAAPRSQAGGRRRDGSTNGQNQNGAGAWDAAPNQEKQTQSGGYSWDNSGEANRNTQDNNDGWNNDTAQDAGGGQDNNDGWGNNGANNDQQDTGWDNGNNGGGDQGNWDANAQNNTPNDEWGNSNAQNNTRNNDWGNDNNGGDDHDNNGGNDAWDSGQNDQNNHDDNNQNGGDWNTGNANGQDSGWDNSGQDWNNTNQHNNDNNNPGDAWDNNNNPNAQDPQPSNSNNWNTTASNQNGWGHQNGGPNNDTIPATTGGPDPSKPSKSRSGEAKSTLSRQPTNDMNSATQKPKKGRHNNLSISVPGTGFPQQQSGGAIPGAWPDPPLQNGPAGTGTIKPYHIIPDAAGNPRLPTLTPVIPIPVPSAPPPPPPPAPAVKVSSTSNAIQSGNPALYQHKTASPRYIDTHDRPYASFVFSPKYIYSR
ncbi:MAG: hypothetical protein Q9168_004793 [Polycauliona sp. 1 TL-2023]